MRYLLVLLFVTNLFATELPKGNVGDTIKQPAKTDAAKAKLPEVDSKTADSIKSLVIEGQQYQIQLNSLEKTYRQVAEQSNEQLALIRKAVQDAVKAAGLDPEKVTVDVSAKGVVTFQYLPAAAPVSK